MSRPEQLQLDFSQSVTQRAKAAARTRDQLTLFASWAPNIDLHLHSADEAVAHLTGKEPEQAQSWLQALVGSTRILKRNRVAFPANRLDRLAFIRPPARVTMDAATLAVASALHARALGCKPMVVTKLGRRIMAQSPRGWPPSLKVTDAPWPAIEALISAGVPLTVDPNAQHLMQVKLGKSGTRIAVATVSGNSIFLRSEHPSLLESLNLPALSYVGDKFSGNYRLPLLCGGPLLKQPMIGMGDEVTAAIKRVTKKTRPLIIEDENFPYTLWDFQAEDAGEALRSLQVSGGVLLALSMGAGKTTVSLALAHHLRSWPALVVAPLSAFSTWARQLEEMGKTYMLATGSPKKNWQEISENNYDAYVVSYDRLDVFAELLRTKGLQVIIADEIQRIKNPGSKRSRALRAMASAVPYRIGLSGTPLVNGLGDLTTLGNFLVPGEWPPRASHKALEDRYPGDSIQGVTDHLHSMMVRRKISDVGRELPRRTDSRVYVALTMEQKKALHDLEEEARLAKESGEFDGAQGKFNALVKLQRMRSIVANPKAAGIGGPNPKLTAAVKVVKQFVTDDRRGVLFVADRQSYQDAAAMLDQAGIAWSGIWGSSSAEERIEAENLLHRKEVSVVLCTIQAAAESWSATPEGTFAVFASYVYAAATLEQAEARVYRLNSDLNGPEIRIVYIHASDPAVGESVDDRMATILDMKKALFAQVVDRDVYEDTVEKHKDLSDLLYVLTGTRDTQLELAEEDSRKASAAAVKRKEHARRTLYGRKGRNKTDGTLVHDTGEQAITLEEFERSLDKE